MYNNIIENRAQMLNVQFLYPSVIYTILTVMHYTSLEKEEARTRKLLLGIFYVCAISMAAITAYALYVSIVEYMSSGRVVIGEVLVYTDFPVHGLAKLVTYLMIVSVIGWYCITKLGGDKVKDIPKPVKSILQLVVLGIAVVALYEFIYNSIIWNSLITADAVKGVIRLDNINLAYPNPNTPWNLVFATKMSLAAFLISAHGFYTMSNTKERLREQKI
jgi:hypothetical protein